MPTGSTHNPQEFVQAFRLGEERAFDYFFREYFPPLSFFACRLIRQEEDAKDIVQDCFLRLWDRHTEMTNPLAIKSFLYTSIRNACIDYLRKQKIQNRREGSLPDETLPEEGEEWDREVTHAELLREISGLINALPARMREVFKLFYLEGKNYQQIADLLKTSPETVRKQKSKALAQLREKLLVLLSIFIIF